MARVSLSWALILGLLAGIGPMCTDLYLPALPEMSEQLAATTTITQLTLTASLIGLGVGQLLFGPLSDKIGRKRPLILSLLLFIVSSILCATTNNIYWLVDAPRDKCTLSCAINGIHAAFHYLKKNYISGCVMTVPTG